MMSESKKVKKLASTVTGEYDYQESLNRILDLYLMGKAKIKDPDQEITDKLIKDLEDLAKTIVIKQNRMKILHVSVIAEKKWMEMPEHKEMYNASRKDLNSMFVMCQILKDHSNNMSKEFKMCYKILKTLQANPVSKRCMTRTAIVNYLNKINQRYRGKNNPIDILIFDEIKYTPFLGYGTYLARQDIDIWHYAKELLPDIRILSTDPFTTNHPLEEVEKEIDKLFYPMIEYVYSHNKLNHVQNRLDYLGHNDEKEAERKIQKEEAKKAKAQIYYTKHINKGIESHNNWWTTGGSYGRIPKGYVEFIQKRKDTELNQFVIIGVIKHKNNYKHGYLIKDDQLPIQYSLKDVYLYNTAKEAVEAIKDFKERGIILDGSPVMI